MIEEKTDKELIEEEFGEVLITDDKGLSVRIILIEPASEGNVGSICRAMKNFGFNDLWLVKPCKLGDFAKAMASHARDVLEEVITVGTLDEALQGCDLVVGTTGKPGESMRQHIRVPYFTPSELRTMLEDKSGRVAILFGREDHGLSAEELSRCDIVINIPASDEYPVLNISHAVAIVLYEIAGIEGGDFPLAQRRDAGTVVPALRKPAGRDQPSRAQAGQDAAHVPPNHGPCHAHQPGIFLADGRAPGHRACFSAHGRGRHFVG